MPRNADSLWTLGNKAADNGDYRSALAIYSQARAIDPTINVDRWLRWGKILEDQNQYVEARSRFTEAADKAPGNPAAHEALASLESDLGNHHTAVLHFLRAFETGASSPSLFRSLTSAIQAAANSDHLFATSTLTVLRLDRPDAYVEWADALERTRPVDARILVDAAIARDPDLPTAHRALAQLLLPTDPAAAVAELQKAVALNPTLPGLHGDLADSLMAAGRAEESFDELVKGLEHTPPGEEDAHLYTLATAAARSAEPANARRAIGVRLKQLGRPEVEMRWQLIMGSVEIFDLSSAGQFELALDKTLAFLDSYPAHGDFVESSLSEVFASGALSLSDEVANRVQTVLDRLRPQLPATLFARWARVLYDGERYDLARNNILVAIQKDPGDEFYRRDLAGYAASLPDQDPFFSRADFLTSFGPEGSAEQYLRLGTWFSETSSRPAAALGLLAAAVRKVESDPAPHVKWGEALAKLNQQEAAVDRFKQALSHGAPATVFSALARALSLSGNHDEAVLTLTRALEDEVGRADALAALEEISELVPDKRRFLLEVQPTVEKVARGQDWAQWGDLLSKAGLHEAAIGSFRRAIAMGPPWRYPRLFFSLYQELLRLDATESQIAQVTEDVRKLDSGKASLEWGRFLPRLSHHKLSIEQLTKAQTQSNDPQILVELGWAHHALEQGDRALAVSEEALRRAPDNWRAHDLRIAILMGLGRYDDAIEQSRAALKLDDQEATFWVLFNWGISLDALGRYREAVEQYEAARKVKPEHPYPLHNIASLLDKQGRYEDAWVLWKEASSLYERHRPTPPTPPDPDALLYSAWVLQGKFLNAAEAGARLKEAHSFNRRNPRILESLMTLSLEEADWEVGEDNQTQEQRTQVAERRSQAQREAWQTYLKLRDILEEDIRREGVPTDRLRLARIESRINDNMRAKRDVEALLKVDSRLRSSELPEAHALFAELQLKEGNFKEAISSLERALSSEPDNLDYHSSLAKAHLKAKETGKARDEYEKLLQRAPRHIDAISGLGEALMDLADDLKDDDSSQAEELYTKACEQFTSALDLDKSSEVASKRLLPREKASLHYLRGYARSMLYELRPRGSTLIGIARLGEAQDLLLAARKDFQKVPSFSPDYFKARRGIKQIDTKRHVILRGWSTAEMLAMTAVIGPALFIFGVAQHGHLVGTPKINKESFVLTERVVTNGPLAGMSSPMKAALVPILNREFLARDNLAKVLKDVLPGDSLASLRDRVLAASLTGTPVVVRERMDDSTYLATSLAAILFVVVGLYLQQLSKLKVGPIELDKSSTEQVRTAGTLGLSRSL